MGERPDCVAPDNIHLLLRGKAPNDTGNREASLYICQPFQSNDGVTKFPALLKTFHARPFSACGIRPFDFWDVTECRCITAECVVHPHG